METNVFGSRKILAFIALALLAAGVGTALYESTSVDAMEQSGEKAAPPPMPVDIVEIKAESIEIWNDFSGNVVAVDRAEIRPQVEGRITEIRFIDGQNVQKGDVLFVIDPRTYEAALNQAKAALENAKVQAQLAQKEYERAKSLIKTEAISQSLMDERDNNRKATAAAVQGAEAAVQRAEIDLDFAYVKAPISGRVSRAEITIGNLVQKTPNAPLLTTIVSQDKVYVDFEVDERTYIDSVRASNGSKQSEGQKIPVRLLLESGSKELDGYVHSFDNRIDPSSGTIRARAIFDNKEGYLLPGMAVSVKMGGNLKDKQILVTERAIGTDQDRKFVFVLGEGNAATYREVKIGPSVSGRRVILDGLKEGDKVITSGITRIRPGTIVAPKGEGAEQVQANSAASPEEASKVEE